MFRKKRTTVEQPSLGRVPVAAVITLTAVATAGCGGFELPDGGGAGGSGGPGLDPCVGGCNGVYVACANPGDIPQVDPGGADGGSEGGDDGGSNGEPPDNWFWSACSGIPSDLGCAPDDEHCCTPGFAQCYCKTYDNSGSGMAQSIGNVCVGNGTPPGLDPLADWDGGSYPAFESQIKPLCETKCNQLDQSPLFFGFPPSCAASTWGIPLTLASWEPSDGANCSVPQELNGGDPFGIGVPWSSVGGSSNAVPLSCDLTDSCADSFVPSVRPYVLNTPEAAPIDAETRSARFLSVSDSSARPEFQVGVDYAGNRYDEKHPIYGLMEYSRSDCGESACPFYLANLSADNTTDSWTVPIKLDTGSTVIRTLSDLRIDLLQSTLGIENTTLGKVAFAPGSLRLGVGFVVAGTSYGSGEHSFVVENDDYVFADVTPNGLDLDYTFALQSLGFATLSLPLVADEHPPLARHDVTTTNAACGFSLTSASLLSADPDGDLEDEYWIVDGDICGSTCALAPGSHDVAVVAVDSRGAVDVSASHTVTVSGC